MIKILFTVIKISGIHTLNIIEKNINKNNILYKQKNDLELLKIITK